MSEKELSELRREYAAGGLEERSLAVDPFTMFRTWMSDAQAADLHEPNAMVLATVSVAGGAASRTVLLKGHDERGFVFFTNYASRKGVELAANPACSVLFPWHALERQVRVEGSAARLSDQDNDAYFSTRPRDSQIGAWASPQSEVVADRSDLDERYARMAERFAAATIPRPGHWGGYRIEPDSVEFWQGRIGRMHDRLRYRRTTGGWAVERLAP